MAVPDINPKDFVILKASSNIELQRLIELTNKIENGKIFQLFDGKMVCCREHLYWAYLNARVSFSNHTNRAKTLQMEMLLFAAFTSQIGKAINRIGAKSNTAFIVFCDSKNTYSKFAKYLEKVSEFRVSASETSSRLKKLGIKSGKISGLLQEMALSGMER